MRTKNILQGNMIEGEKVANDIPLYWKPEEVTMPEEVAAPEEAPVNELPVYIMHVPTHKNVYGYDPTTGQYTGVVRAFECPIEKGVFHIPAYATDIAPAKTGENERCYFDPARSAWTIKAIQKPYEKPEEVISLADQVRNKRNELLAASDYTQLGDYPGDTIAAQTYRQALRDITNQKGFPEKVVWPELPTKKKS
jgi:hypothetical protein